MVGTVHGIVMRSIVMWAIRGIIIMLIGGIVIRSIIMLNIIMHSIAIDVVSPAAPVLEHAPRDGGTARIRRASADSHTRGTVRGGLITALMLVVMLWPMLLVLLLLPLLVLAGWRLWRSALSLLPPPVGD